MLQNNSQFKNNFKKIFAKSILISVFMLSLTTNNAKAIPVFDGGNFIQNTLTAMATPVSAVSNGISSSVDITEKLKEYGLDKVANNIGKVAIQQIKNQMLNWMKNGFNGQPTFIADPERFFGNIAGREVNLFVSGYLSDPTNRAVARLVATGINNPKTLKNSVTRVMTSTVCSKLANDYRLAVKTGDIETRAAAQAAYNNSCAPGGNKSVQYKNQQQCAKSFACGGFDSILATTRNLGNTDEGVYSAMLATTLNEINKKTADLKNQQASSGGFLDSYKCVTAKRLNTETGEYYEDKNDEGINLGINDVCTKQIKTNPASVSQSITDQITKDQIQQGQQVDELGEFIGAAAEGLLRNILSGDGLFGKSAPVAAVAINNTALSGASNAYGGVVGTQGSNGSISYGFSTVKPGEIDQPPQVPLDENGKPDLSKELPPDSYKIYMEGNLQLINIKLKENGKARTFVQKEIDAYIPVANAYNKVANCYSGIVSNPAYPENIPLEIRKRAGSIDSSLKTLQATLNGSLKVDSNVNVNIKLMTETPKMLNILDYYKNKIEKELETNGLSLADWTIRNQENKGLVDEAGKQIPGLYDSLKSEIVKTVGVNGDGMIMNSSSEDSYQSPDSSHLGACLLLK